MLRSSYFKRGLFAAWLILAAASIYLLVTHHVSFKDIPEALRAFMQAQGVLGPFLYIVIYWVRPLILFPASVLTLAAGLAWGPLWGSVYTIIGENISSAIAFWLGRYFGRNWAKELNLKIVHGIDRHLREHGFITVLILRLTYIPFDPVNFGCGMTSMSFKQYAAGTFLGILPGVICFAYFGGGIFDRSNLIVGACVFLLSLILAHFIKESKSGKKVLKSALKPGPKT